MFPADGKGSWRRPKVARNGRRKKQTTRGTDDDSDREIRADKLVVSSKTTQDCSKRRRWFQYDTFSCQSAVETGTDCLAVSELLLVHYWQAWKVPWFRLFHMALAWIQEDRLVRAGAEAWSAWNNAAGPAQLTGQRMMHL
jgi:hypothetical protein